MKKQFDKHILWGIVIAMPPEWHNNNTTTTQQQHKNKTKEKTMKKLMYYLELIANYRLYNLDITD